MFLPLFLVPLLLRHLVGSVIGFAGNFAITLLSNKQQMEKEKLAHELQLEREKKA